MSTETKILGIILIVTLALVFGAVFLLSPKDATEAGRILQIDYSKGQKIGSDSAKVKLVEFSDFQCPACQAVEPFIEKLHLDYPDQVQIIYRHFPLSQHTHSQQAAILAESSGEQGKFWEMHDRLFGTQQQWSGLPDATPFFQNLVKELGLDENKIKQSEEDNNIKVRIDEDIAEGNRLGVSSTPTFFLNGRKLNLQNFADLNMLVSNELKK